MFAYAGYVPLSRLWGIFEEKYLKWCCARACEFYGAEKSDCADIFGSPRDLCEDLFLASLSELSLTLCTTESSVLDVDATLPGTNAKLFQKTTVMESFSIAMFEDEAGPSKEWLTCMGSPQFQPTGHTNGEVNEWITKYSKLSESEADIHAVKVPFHTLPYLFERQSYVIAGTFPPWSKDMWDAHYERNLPDQCRGASICLKEDLAEQWQQTLSEAALRKGLKRLTPSVSFAAPKAVSKRRGRPEKLSKVKEAILEFAMELAPLTWPARTEFLSEKMDIAVSQSTVRNAYKALKEKGRLGRDNG